MHENLESNIDFALLQIADGQKGEKLPEIYAISRRGAFQKILHEYNKRHLVFHQITLLLPCIHADLVYLGDKNVPWL